MKGNLNAFVELIRNQFNEDDRYLINERTDIKVLKSWSSLQVMIVVNEIDKEYGVILDNDDFKSTDSLAKLFQIIQAKLH